VYLLSVSVIAAASIGYELLLIRLMSIIQWHHFAYMIISLALLGFGASGTFLVLAKPWLLQRQRFSLWSFAIFFSVSSILCFYLVQKIPFNPLEVPWSGLQFIYLSINYLLLMIPFFCSVVALGALSSCDSPQEDCYKKVYKMWKKRGNSDGSAAQNAAGECFSK